VLLAIYSAKTSFALTDLKSKTPRLTHVTTKAGPVGGVTTVGGRFYVLRTSGEIEEYEALSFSHKLLPLCSLGGKCLGLASCAENNCLYVSDYNADTISRINLNDNYDVTSWSTAQGPVGLSVDQSANLLVACYSSPNLVQEFTTQGSLVREIRVRSLIYPLHAIRRTDGRLAICHGQWGSEYTISVVNNIGLALCSSSKFSGSVAMAMDERGCVITGDWANNRVLRLTSSLNVERDFQLSAESQLQEPFAICVDEEHSRLYVGELSGGRVLVFDIVMNVVST
jgi:DNA-binding beta-propeller fold protein YncE